jgi:hypothetical protein
MDGTFEGALLGMLDGEELGITDGASDGKALGCIEIEGWTETVG